jgi:nitrate reductase NapAB chaperone NapD
MTRGQWLGRQRKGVWIIPISSLILRIGEGYSEAVRATVSSMEGVTISSEGENALAILSETVHPKEDKAIWAQLENIEGVLALELVYHNFEDMEGSMP